MTQIDLNIFFSHVGLKHGGNHDPEQHRNDKRED